RSKRDWSSDVCSSDLCDPKIIAFNNKKYYNQKLQVASKGKSKRPLVYVNLPHDTSTEKNTAPAEVDLIDRYLSKYPEKSVGIIRSEERRVGKERRAGA